MTKFQEGIVLLNYALHGSPDKQFLGVEIFDLPIVPSIFFQNKYQIFHIDS